MSPPIRGACLRQRKSRMPKVSRDQARTAALRLCGLGEGELSFRRSPKRLRILRRSPWPRRLLSPRHELAKRILVRAAPINHRHRHVEQAEVCRRLPARLMPVIQQESSDFFEEYGPNLRGARYCRLPRKVWEERALSGETFSGSACWSNFQSRATCVSVTPCAERRVNSDCNLASSS